MKRKSHIFLLILIGILSISISNCKKDETPPTKITDYDGNVYHTIIIGTQVWMVENLKVTHYQNGDTIPNVTDEDHWLNLKTGGCCYYNDDKNIANTYGLLYNWYAITDSRNICPKGWRIPSDADWETLEKYLGGVLVAGDKMKEVDTIHWMSPNTGATNESKFTGLPGGCRFGSFYDLGREAYWWSSTSISSTNASSRGLRNDEAIVTINDLIKSDGNSIRCLWNK